MKSLDRKANYVESKPNNFVQWEDREKQKVQSEKNKNKVME